MKISTTLKTIPATVKLGSSRQVVIPKKVHEQLGLTPGTILEVEIRAGSLVYTPKSLADWEGRQAYLEARADAKAGRLSGPFDTADELVQHLDRVTNRRRSR